MWTTSAKDPRALRLFAAAVLLLAGGGCTGTTPTNDHRAPLAAGPGLDNHATAAGPSGGPTALHGSWDVSQLADPCRALTQDEAAKILAIAVGAPQKVDSWPPVCAFGLTALGPLGVGPEGKPSITEYLYLLDDSADSGKVDFETGRANPAVVEPVAGIGDQAYWTPDKTELQVISGKTHVITKFGGANPPPGAKDKAIAITRISLPRAIPT